MNRRDTMQMTKEADINRPLSKEVPSRHVLAFCRIDKIATDIKSKDIDNIYVPNAKDGDNNRPLAKGHVNNILVSKVATSSSLPDSKEAVNNRPLSKGAFSKHILAAAAWTR